MDDMELEDYVTAINQWGLDRNITPEGGATVMAQMSKMTEEFAEFLATYSKLEEVCAAHDCSLERLRGVLNNYTGSADISEDWELLHKLEDDFGDMLVCLIQAMRLANTDMRQCLSRAWHGTPTEPGIKNRKGRMVDGKFVKES